MVATDDLQANSYYATSTFKEAFNSNFSYATSDALPTKEDSDVDEPENETGKTSFVFVYRLCIQWTIRVFSRDILKGGNIGVRAGGRGVLGVYYLLENIMHYIITANLKGGRQQSSTLQSSFIQNFDETKGYSPGFFFRDPKKYVVKSESKRKEKLNGTCFSCIAHVSREL